jgi:hypothetical protein
LGWYSYTYSQSLTSAEFKRWRIRGAQNPAVLVWSSHPEFRDMKTFVDDIVENLGPGTDTPMISRHAGVLSVSQEFEQLCRQARR